MAKELTQNQGKWTWKRRGAYKVLELAKKGKSASEIAEIVKWREDTVWHFMSSPTFLRKLNDYLKCVFFNFQKNKILALEEVFKLLWNVAMGREKIEGITTAVAFRHLIKLLKIQEEPKITDPQKSNIIMNIPKTQESKESRDLAEVFGFKDLQIPAGEGPEVSPELNE